jgi:hypothetical protein
MMFTLQEAASLSGFPRHHLVEDIELGRLKAWLIKHGWRIARADLGDYIRCLR